MDINDLKTSETAGVHAIHANIDSLSSIATAAKPATLPGAPLAPVTISDTSAQSAIIGATLVRVVATTDCLIAFGTNPTATANSIYLPDRSVEYFFCDATHKIAAIRDTANGTLYVTPVA